MNHHTNHSVVTSTRKRRDRGDLSENTSSFYKGSFGNSHKPSKINNNITNTTSSRGITTNEPSAQSSRLLAGYMAHEFLTKGTLFGQKFDPARAEAMPILAAEPKRKPVHEPVVIKPVNRSYADVAQLLKGEEGAHIPGIVNPTQLAKWIQM